MRMIAVGQKIQVSKQMFDCRFVQFERVGSPVGQFVRLSETDEIRNDDSESGRNQFGNQFVKRVRPKV